MNRLFWIALGLTLAPWVAQAAGLSTADLSTQGAADILRVHNRERAALKIVPLVWDESLAVGATVWAQELAASGRPRHSAKAERGPTGENIWAGTAGAYTPTEMAEAWADEKAAYHYGVFTGVGSGPEIGHYTQMIWNDTTKLGCGLATAKGVDYLVCRYGPAGNVVGHTPY